MKDKKKKNNKKTKKISVSLILIVLLLGGVLATGIYFFLNTPDETSKLTLMERQWIEKNNSTLIDIKVPNNIYIYASEGEGVLFDFLTYLESNTGLGFNKVSYVYPYEEDEDKMLSLLVLKNTDKLKENDVFIADDSYVLLGLNEGYLSSSTDIINTNVGVLNNDIDNIKTSVNDNVNFKTYTTYDSLYKALTDKLVDYILVPRYVNLKLTTDNKLYTKYNFNNIANKIVLRLGNNERLNNIVVKSLNEWKKNGLRDAYEEALYNYFIDNFNISEIDKTSLVNKEYRYGFVKNTAYNLLTSNKGYGIAFEYIKAIESMGNIEFSYNEYQDETELSRAISNNEIDIAFIEFPYEGEELNTSLITFESKLAVLSKEYKNINDISGLSNNKLFVYGNSNVESFVNNINAVVKEMKSLNTNIDDNLLVLDYNEYLYHKNKELSSYNLLFVSNYDGNYHYLVNNNNEVISSLIDFVLNNTDYNYYETISTNNLVKILNNKENFKNVYMIILAVILIPIVLLIIVIVATKNVKRLKTFRKEEVLRNIDMLTSLKNRNYLHANIKAWSEQDVFPRSIIIVDLNNLKYVNDNYGYEEGNLLIKKAAAILMNTQLENSEIIRSDGNEFLLYLIGYSKTQIESYIKTLQKALDELPNGFGAACGYSMITDKIKTIDDAINEATIEMRIDKEQNFK